MYIWQSFASFQFWHKKTHTIDIHNLDVNTYYDLWRKINTSIDMLEIWSDVYYEAISVL